MSALLAMVQREARDARMLVLLALPVGAFLCSGADLFVADFSEPHVTMRVILPVLTGGFAATLATDLIAPDALTGRSATLAILPIAPLRVWLAKVLWLALASCGFALFLTSAQLTLASLLGPPLAGAGLVEESPAAIPGLGLAAAVGAATLLVSTVFRGGFVAFGCGLSAALPLAWLDFIRTATTRESWDHPFEYWAVSLVSDGEMAALTSVCAAAWLAVSALFYCRTLGGRRADRGTWALAVVIVVGLPAVAVGGIALHVRATRNLTLDDPAIRIDTVTPSPDGTYAVVEISRADPAAYRAFIVRVSDGGSRALPWWRRVIVPVFTEAGDVRTKDAWEPRWVEEIYLTPPADGATRRVALPQTRSHENDDDWGHASRYPGSQRLGFDGVVWTGREAQRSSKAPWGVRAGLDHIMIEARWGDRAVRWHDLSTGATRTLGEHERNDRRALLASPDGTRLLGEFGDRYHSFDLRTAEALAPPFDVGLQATWNLAGHDDRSVWLTGAGSRNAWLVDIETGARRRLPRSAWEPFGEIAIERVCAPLPDGHLLVVRPEGRALDIVNAHDHLVRRLIEIPGGAR